MEPIVFERKDAGGSQPITYGYEATKLIDLCDALIELNKAGILRDNQKIYAEQAEMIIRSVAKVGIIALVPDRKRNLFLKYQINHNVSNHLNHDKH